MSEVHPHTHTNGDGGHGHTHCHTSDKYKEYILINLDDLKTKCEQLTICINKLLSQEGAFSVLRGRNLSLKRICQLINVKDANSTESMMDGKCSIHERLDIMADVESHLEDKIERDEPWYLVPTCLEGKYGDNEKSTYVADICSLAEESDPICDDIKTHNEVEKFVNEQISHLQCTCKSLQRDIEHSHEPMSTPVLVGIGAAGLLLLCIVIGLSIFCWRRKNKKKKRPNVIYVPSSNLDCPVYQEIYDHMSPSGSVSHPPHRYGSRPLPQHPDDEDPEYLEPVQAGSNSYRSRAPAPLGRLVNNRGYAMEKPPEYSLTDQTYEEAILMPSEHAPGCPPQQDPYFQPIETPKEKKSQSYDTLQREAEQAENACLTDDYQPLEDVVDDDGYNNIETDELKPLGPIPAKRTKKEDRQTESEYFELEKEERLETEIV